MPRYFFNVRRGDGVRLPHDDEGERLPSRGRAEEYARPMARELAKDEGYAPGEVIVVDEAGTELLRIPITPLRLGG